MANDILYPIRCLHGQLYEWNLYRKKRNALKKAYIQKLQMKLKKNPLTVFLVFTPEHSNLGDHAIAFAETELLQSSGFDYVEVTGEQLVKIEQYNLLGMMNGYPIVVQGGGN